ncbi:unnamed protein product [Durusdinium trenchii]|uniref:Uncharacterized protein n=1 Tax=Durusdinium trenchii TaxID=1381693 RepID=A0ABP0KTV0_9DINO
MSETVVPCLQNDAHKIGAVVAIFTALSSSSLAHLLHHIGTDVPEEYSLRGCRGRIIQDISCGGIYLPEYLIFAIGFTFVSLCMCHAFQKAGYILEKYSTLSSRLVRVFRMAGLVGCVSMIPMAWISMRFHRGFHLLFAGLTMGPWCVAFSVRCYSGCPPYHRFAVITCVMAAVLIVWWFTSILLGFSKQSWAEWVAFICFLLHTFTFPVPASRSSIFRSEQEQAEVELEPAGA